MMRYFSKFAFVTALAFVLAGLSGCTSPAPTNSTAGANTSTARANSGEPKKSSEFPPLAEKVATADMKNLDGTTFKVTDRKGKVLLLNMWATWCGPCRSEMPSLVRMQDEHRDQGFEVIGLNTDDGDTKEMIDKFAAELKLNYTLVWADSAMQAALLKISNFGGIPQSFVVDRDGNLRGVFRGANPADIKKMEELVAKVVNGDDSPYVPSEKAPDSPPFTPEQVPPSNKSVPPQSEKVPSKDEKAPSKDGKSKGQ